MGGIGFFAVVVLAMLVPCLAFCFGWLRLSTAPSADLVVLVASCVLAPLLLLAMWWHLDTKVSGPSLVTFLALAAICAMVSHELATLKKRRFRTLCILGLIITIPCYFVGTSIVLFTAASLFPPK